PGDADESAVNLNAHNISGGEAVEVTTINRNTLEVPVLAPRRDDEPTARHRTHHGEFADDAGRFDLRLAGIEGAVAEEHQGEEPRDRNQGVIKPLQDFDFGVF